MRARISSVALQRIRAAAAASPHREVCGLLFGTPDRIDVAEPCDNVSAHPHDSFEIDPCALIAAHRRARGGGAALVGYYHSHPSGCAMPSPRDAAMAAPDGMVWLIVADSTVAAFRAQPIGTIEGRFDPIALQITGSTCADEDPPPEGQRINGVMGEPKR
jgi:proteasome lid subunit RPN8/RPN11